MNVSTITYRKEEDKGCKVASSVGYLEIDLLLLCTEISQFKWLGHLIWLPPRHLTLDDLHAQDTWREAPG